MSAENPEYPLHPEDTPYAEYGPVDPTVQPVPAAVTARVDAADSTLQNPRTAVIALGGNLGNRLETLQGAVDALEDTPGVRVRSVSPVYETEPWGVPPGSQPSYFNAVVLVRTTLPPADLLERGHAIEEAYLRVRTERWGPRTIDVDIVAYDGRGPRRPGADTPAPARPRARLRPRTVVRRGPGGGAARPRAGRRAARADRQRRGTAARRRGTPAARIDVGTTVGNAREESVEADTR